MENHTATISPVNPSLFINLSRMARYACWAQGELIPYSLWVPKSASTMPLTHCCPGQQSHFLIARKMFIEGCIRHKDTSTNSVCCGHRWKILYTYRHRSIQTLRPGVQTCCWPALSKPHVTNEDNALISTYQAKYHFSGLEVLP